MTTSCARSRACSLVIARWMCVRTVSGLTTNRSAISLLVRPSAASAITSRSRAARASSRRATLLAGAVTTPVTGGLGDLYGKRRMLIVCTVPLVLGSLLCALAGNVGMMIAGRGLQGMGMGVVALGISALRDVM